MSWILILTLIAFAVFTMYNVTCDCILGIPSSLSDTFYLLNGKKKGLGYLFSAMMVSMAGMLMPAWIQLSEGSNWQFTAFLAAAAIIFVGVAPAFKSDGMEGKVHTIAAICAAIFALAWCFAVAQTWYIVFLSTGAIIGLAYWTKSTKCVTYWLEMVAFISTFLSIITYYFIK